MWLDEILELALVIGLQAHLVDLVKDIRTLLDAQLLEHLVDIWTLTRHGSPLLLVMRRRMRMLFTICDGTDLHKPVTREAL